MRSPITAEERAWGLECAASGDTLAEIAAWSGRSEAEWRPILGRWNKLTATDRERLSLVTSGVTQAEAAQVLGTSRKAIAQTLLTLRKRGFSVQRGVPAIREVLDA